LYVDSGGGEVFDHVNARGETKKRNPKTNKQIAILQRGGVWGNKGVSSSRLRTGRKEHWKADVIMMGKIVLGGGGGNNKIKGGKHNMGKEPAKRGVSKKYSRKKWKQGGRPKGKF